MLRFFVSLMLMVLLFFIPTLSEAQIGDLRLPIFSFVGFSATNESEPHPVQPGGVLEVDLSVVAFTRLCIEDPDSDVDCSMEGIGRSHLPPGTKLFSSSPDVAFVDEINSDIVFQKPGLTILTLQYVSNETEIQLSKVGTLAYYTLVIRPVPPGTPCDSFRTGLPNFSEGIIDCSGKCVFADKAYARLGDGICDDGSTGFDLSSCLIRNRNDSLSGLSNGFVNDEIDGGDCNKVRDLCRARFGDAPGFQLCSSSVDVCSFNARTDGGTCEDMCQRFNSRCVAALDNDPAGCTSLPDSIDTCQTPRQSEICFCARR